MSTFHEIRFPTDLSFGSSGGPERRTDIVTLNSGFEERNSPWADSRRRYDAGLAARNLDDLEKIIAFFEARHGKLYGFRWKDWSDYSSGSLRAGRSNNDQEIGIGDGEQTIFQIVKNYRSGDNLYKRDIKKIVAGSLSVAMDGQPQILGTDYSVDQDQGVITFEEAPAESDVISCGYEFDVPVRFDTDFLDINAAGFEAGDIPSVPVVEIRV